jgi:hypothetical protein
MMLTKLQVAAAVLLCATAAKPLVGATPKEGVTILGTTSYWRCCYVYGTDLVKMTDGKLVHVHPANITKMGKKTVNGKRVYFNTVVPHEIARVWGAPPAAWASPDFDDSTWPRLRGPFMIGPYRTPQFGYRSMPMACLRGKFRIKAPADGFKLSVGYHGGIVVFLNGKEILRKHLPEGELKPETPAEEYPLEVYVDAKGKALGGKVSKEKLTSLDQYIKRIRTIHDFQIPAGKLRKGVNVLAIELHRAPGPQLMFESRVQFARWSRIGLTSVGLTGPVDAAESVLGRPAGFQVWTTPVYEEVSPTHYGDPCDSPGLVRLCTGQNGIVSGQVVAGSPTPFKGLKVELSDLKGPGTIPASAIQVRYARLGWSRGRNSLPTFMELEELPPDEVSISKGRGSGAVQPVWLTVRVPADAKPGVYKGTVAVSAAGQESEDVPIKLRVVN